jgi:phospholipase A1
MKVRKIVLLILLTLSFSGFANDNSFFEKCVTDKALNSDGQLTLAEIRQSCKTESELERNSLRVSDNASDSDQTNSGLLSQRMQNERATQFSDWVITPHKQNYVLPFITSSDINKEAYRTLDGFEENLEESEAKFQLSLKVPLNTGDLLVEGDALYMGFTLQAWWQIYASGISKPFRETNYQPELFYLAPTSWKPFGGSTALVLGIEHQSNGRGQNLSRSWNRAYLNFLYEKDNFALSFRPWYRLPEDEKEFEFDPEGDDNPDIDDFMGDFELGMVYKFNELEFGFSGRQNFSTNNGAAEFTLSFPLYGKLRGYATAFNGYGESLIDYNHRQTRFGIGLSLNNVL